jgi:GGDEF domain-containing protein
MSHQVIFLNENEKYDLNKLMGYDALVIDSANSSFTRSSIKEIRSHSQSEIALKPLFLLSPRETEDPFIRYLHDGIVFSAERIKELAPKIDQLFLRTTQLSSAIPDNFDEQILKRTIDYLYTRNVETVHPYLDPRSAIGYSWPEFSVHFESFEESKTFEILETAHKNGFFSTQFVDRIHVCNGCNSGFIHLHEACPTCNSRNIETEDLIHHFPCAYVGPIRDFKDSNTEALMCPKCDKTLRHIGIDYDKPSVISHCNSCNKNFQDTSIIAKCLYCKKQMEIEYLMTRNICNYTLTKKGKHIATTGASFFKSNEENVSGTISFSFYKEYLFNQLARMKNGAASNAVVLLLEMNNIDDVYRKVGETGQKQLISSIVQIIRSNIRTSDLIAMENPFYIHICLNDYQANKVDPLIENLISRLTALLKDNVEIVDMVLTCKQHVLTKDTSVDQVLNELNS